ncbi:MAG: replication initiation protein [Rhodopila sp.]
METIKITDFRELLGVPPGTYERGLDFQRKVIEPAVLEVNGLSDMKVEIAIQRKHARAPIQAVTLSWWRKSGDEFRDAVQERNRSKVGRMARLRGQMEAATPGIDELPALVDAETAERLAKTRAVERERPAMRVHLSLHADTAR